LRAFACFPVQSRPTCPESPEIDTRGTEKHAIRCPKTDTPQSHLLCIFKKPGLRYSHRKKKTNKKKKKQETPHYDTFFFFFCIRPPLTKKKTKQNKKKHSCGPYEWPYLTPLKHGNDTRQICYRISVCMGAFAYYPPCGTQPKTAGLQTQKTAREPLIAIQQCHGNTASDPRRAEAAKKQYRNARKITIINSNENEKRVVCILHVRVVCLSHRGLTGSHDRRNHHDRHSHVAPQQPQPQPPQPPPHPQPPQPQPQPTTTSAQAPSASKKKLQPQRAAKANTTLLAATRSHSHGHNHKSQPAVRNNNSHQRTANNHSHHSNAQRVFKQTKKRTVRLQTNKQTNKQ
jgi:hypothetical protein